MDNIVGFASWLRANSCADSTITDRVCMLAAFALEHQSFPDVKPGEITAWVGRPGYAQWTRCTYYGHLRSYYRYALEVGLVTVDPMVKMRRPRSGRGIPRPLTPAQVHKLLAAVAVRDTAAARPTHPHTYAWMVLGLRAGLRAHEIAKIRGEDVDQDQLYVFGKGGQGNYLPTHPAVWALAQELPRCGWWFPTRSASGHVMSSSISRMTSRLFVANGIQGSIHRCRHTYATELLRAGVNIRVVQTLMRHESLSSTQVYCAVDEDERRDAILRLTAA